MTCPCELRAQRDEAARRAEREDYERSLDWQFAVISKAREARGERALTRSEWLAGGYGDEENGDIAPPSRTAPLIVSALYAAAIITAVGVGKALVCIVAAGLVFGPSALVLLMERRIAIAMAPRQRRQTEICRSLRTAKRGLKASPKGNRR